jgi:hypothetical protein
MADPKQTRALTTGVLSLLMAAVGIGLIIRTVNAGGGVLSTGVWLGVLFLAAGCGRLYLSRRPR